MGNPRELEVLYSHMNTMMELCNSLTEKTAYTTLGPADGELYMQLCSTIAAYARSFERSFNDNPDPDPDEGSPDDSGSEGDQPPSSE